MPTDAGPSGEGAASAAFVLCIENNETRGQALLLIESLREFGGRRARCPVFAVAPRAGLGVDPATRARLEELEVTYHEEALNTVCPEYGSANRIYAAAWAARHSSADTLFVLDSDALFLGEPAALGREWDFAVRPVDLKGPTSEGPGDPFESYWTSMCELAGMSVESLPFVETVLDRRRVRASYNGGYAVVRRASGILERAADLFTRSVHSDLRPYKGAKGHRVFASTGYVLPLASEYWGSNQAALAIAAWSTTQRVVLLDRRVNIPLHELAVPERWNDDWADLGPLHVHYHWLLRASHRDLALATLTRLGVPPAQLEWIREHASVVGKWPVPVPARRTARPGGRTRQLVICGMHRSGTSLVASVLREAGLEIGWDLMGPAPGNWRGHFEDSEFYHLQEEMLAAVGVSALTADDSFALPPGSDFERRARQLIDDRRGYEIWGWKDPRTLLLLDFWDALLPEANYLFLYRHPIDVALSLRRRATDPEIYSDPFTGIRSWEVNARRLLSFIARNPRHCFLAQVPALSADLPRFVRRVAAKLDLPLGPVGDALPFAPEELSEALGDLKHFPAWEGLMPEALALYAQLEARADLPSTWTGAETWRPASSAEGGEPAAGSQETIAGLFRDLLQARLARDSGNPPGGLRWTVVEEGRLASAAVALHDAQGRIAALQGALDRAAARRDELAATLTAIESSRGFRWLAGGWRIVERLRRLCR